MKATLPWPQDSDLKLYAGDCSSLTCAVVLYWWAQGSPQPKNHKQENDMGTAANIAIKTGEDEYRVIYCHYDGYQSYLGRLLTTKFRSVAAVTALIDGGDVKAVNMDGTTLPLFAGSPAKTMNKQELLCRRPNANYKYIFDPVKAEWDFMWLEFDTGYGWRTEAARSHTYVDP